MASSESAVRHKVEKIMRERIPDPVWKYFFTRGSVGEVRKNIEEPVWLVREIQKFMIAANLSRKADAVLSPTETPRRQRRNKVISARNDAVSEFIAERARDDQEVRNFRERYLIGAVLSPLNVEAWIDAQSCEYNHAVVVRIPRRTKIRPGPNGLEFIPALTSVKREQIEELVRVDCIAYQRPPSRWAHRKPIGRDGVLRTLLLLSRRLAKTFGWTEVQATMFMLTDVTPEIATAQWEFLPVAPLGCLTRISLTVDLQVTPEELAKKYRTIRSEILGPKHRSLGEKHCRLAVFALKHQDLNQDALLDWNQQYPAWSYRKVSRFAKEARLAKQGQEERLEGLPFHPTKLIRYFHSLETESTVNAASGPTDEPKKAQHRSKQVRGKEKSLYPDPRPSGM